jgi:hypothetical protein
MTQFKFDPYWKTNVTDPIERLKHQKAEQQLFVEARQKVEKKRLEYQKKYGYNNRLDATKDLINVLKEK